MLYLSQETEATSMMDLRLPPRLQALSLCVAQRRCGALGRCRPSATLARPDRHQRRAERCLTEEMDEHLMKNLRRACGLQALSRCCLVASRGSACCAAPQPSAPQAYRGCHDTQKEPRESSR